MTGLPLYSDRLEWVAPEIAPLGDVHGAAGYFGDLAKWFISRGSPDGAYEAARLACSYGATYQDRQEQFCEACKALHSRWSTDWYPTDWGMICEDARKGLDQ